MTATHQGTRSTRRATTVVACIALIAALGSGPASADRPLFQDHVQERHDLHEVPQLTAACGFEVWHEERVNVVIRVFEDGTEEIRLAVHETLVTSTSDEVLEHHVAGSQTRQSSEQLEGDLLVVNQDVRHVGLPSIWRKSGEGVLLRDAGVVDLDVHIVVDLSQEPPQLVERDIQVQTIHGPHPELAMSDEEFTEFVCGALS